MSNAEMLTKMGEGQGFIAALDQSGGSTPKALKAYGIDESEYSGDDEMYAAVHAMRTRIITSAMFGGDRILAAILFENTMDREIEGRGSAQYLWSIKNVVPLLKIDKGLADVADGVQMMKPIPGLDDLLERAVSNGVFGTKERSVVQLADQRGIEAIAEQQFEIGRQVLGHGLVPILEPEVDIHSPEKAEAETMLRQAILDRLDSVPAGQQVMLKLSLPSVDDFYAELIADPRVLRVVALSGGYERDEANAILARNHGMIASFSRALADDLRAQMTDAEFDDALDDAIGSIYEASLT